MLKLRTRNFETFTSNWNTLPPAFVEFLSRNCTIELNPTSFKINLQTYLLWSPDEFPWELHRPSVRNWQTLARANSIKYPMCHLLWNHVYKIGNQIQSWWAFENYHSIQNYHYHLIFFFFELLQPRRLNHVQTTVCNCCQL